MLRLQTPTITLGSFWLFTSYEDYRYLFNQATLKIGSGMQVSFIIKIPFIGGGGGRYITVRHHVRSRSWTKTKCLYPLSHSVVCKFNKHSVGCGFDVNSNFQAFLGQYFERGKENSSGEMGGQDREMRVLAHVYTCGSQGTTWGCWFFSPTMVLRGWLMVSGLQDKNLYLLSHFAGLKTTILYNNYAHFILCAVQWNWHVYAYTCQDQSSLTTLYL